MYTHIYIYTQVFIFPCSLKHDHLYILLCIFENASLIAFVSVLKKLHTVKGRECMDVRYLANTKLKFIT